MSDAAAAGTAIEETNNNNTANNNNNNSKKEEDVVANETLYVNNLNDKLNKKELKKELLNLFREHGDVIDIVALKTLKLRGQAFIIYHSVLSASAAMKALQGFEFYGKPMRISYAKTKSDAILLKQGGTAPPRSNNKKDGSNNNAPPRKKQKMGDDNDGDEEQQQQQQQAQDNSANPPNHILFAENLPAECNDMTLGIIFQAYPGFVSARTVPSRPGLAFIEFQNAMQATNAMANLNNFRMSAKHTLSLSYAKQ